MTKPSYSRRHARLALVLLALVASPTLQAGKLYRWVDSGGRVHYSDSVPPGQVRQGRQELDEQGRVIKSVDRARTKEEIATAQREARKQAREQRIAQEKAATDRVLLQTYTNLDDIVRGRDRKLSAIHATISVTDGRVAKLNQELAKQTENAANAERRGVPVPLTLQETIASIKQQVKDNQRYIANKQAESKTLKTQYDTDIRRYKELKGLR